LSGKRSAGFTLIELLIVVAIIGILAAIAIPNFLLAQVRAKVSRVKADMNGLAVALESYRVDQNAYPYFDNPTYGFPSRYNEISYRLIHLTTPMAYLKTIHLSDPFLEQGADSYSDGFMRYEYNYRNHEVWRSGSYPWVKCSAWVLNSIGPDQSPNQGLLTEMWARGLMDGVAGVEVIIYDPTNGTVSVGDIPRTGGETRFRSFAGR